MLGYFTNYNTDKIPVSHWLHFRKLKRKMELSQDTEHCALCDEIHHFLQLPTFSLYKLLKFVFVLFKFKIKC